MDKTMEDAPTGSSPQESSPSISIALGEASDRPKKARRTFLTQNACTRCRQKKSKCDGKRPICGRCEKNGAECIYDVAQEGITRMQNLQQLLEKRTEDYDRLMTLFNAFQQSSDDVATNLLARLRLGESIESLIHDIESARASSMGDSNEMLDSRRGSTSIHSWPQSPLDDGSWTSWSTRYHPGDRMLSESSESGIHTPRGSTSFKTNDLVPRPPGTHVNDSPQTGYYQIPHQHEGYQDQQGPYFNWQRQDGEVNQDSPTQTLPDGQLSDGLVQDGPFNNETKPVSGASQERQFGASHKSGKGRGGPKKP